MSARYRSTSLRREVVEQPTPPTDEHEQPTARVMVLLVDLQVLREVVDALGEERDLDLR